MQHPFINDLSDKVDENKGKALLKFIVFDPKQNEDGRTTWMQMFSRSHMVEINNDFLKYLESQPNIEYKLE